jgi:hypothetical protein
MVFGAWERRSTSSPWTKLQAEKTAEEYGEGRRSMTESTSSEDNLLLPFERANMPEHYRPYLAAKRNNFFAGIQGSPNLWRYFGLLDLILFTEFQDMARATDTGRMFPLVLFLNAHAKIRVSMELAFSRCMEEARSILRDAIETAVFAHYMLGDPSLQKVWLSKDDGAKEAIEFKEAFEKDKKNRAFKGQVELLEQWGHLSETGAHSTPQAVVSRFVIRESEQDVHFALNYTGVEDRVWEPEVFTLLLNVDRIERMTFDDFRQRLQFDEELMRNRSRAEQLRELCRQQVIRKYNIQPPKSKPKP